MSAPLLAWYRAVARDLPWRSDPSPYHVLLSELMCQQTRVETALPYFRAFVERWPRIEDLAAAEPADVLEAWAGLGYYSRARNLHRCAVAAVAAGGLPSTADGLRALPGIGPYTAGAIASIAFRERAVAVDGNVQRVISRLRAVDEPPSSSAGRRRIEQGARALMDALPDGAHPGDLNQALMELGARVCTPKRPSCAACPLVDACAAAASGAPESWPRSAPRKAPVPVQGVAGVLLGADGPLLVRNPDEGLLAGLWTPPVVFPLPDGTMESALRSAFADVGLEVRASARLGSVTHVFSHRRLTAEVFAVEHVGGGLGVRARWTGVRWGGDVGLSALARRVLAAADDARTSPGLALFAADG